MISNRDLLEITQFTEECTSRHDRKSNTQSPYKPTQDCYDFMPKERRKRNNEQNCNWDEPAYF